MENERTKRNESERKYRSRYFPNSSDSKCSMLLSNLKVVIIYFIYEYKFRKMKFCMAKNIGKHQNKLDQECDNQP